MSEGSVDRSAQFGGSRARALTHLPRRTRGPYGAG